MAPVTPPPMLFMPPTSTYGVGGPSTAAAEGHSHALRTPRFPKCSKVAMLRCDGITIGEIGLKVSAVKGQKDAQIQQLQTMVSEMSSHESTLTQCILGMDRRLANLKRRPPGPQ
ncbi:hypothetical protein Tco_1066536 [Tanacetum coccineum]|uniref:Uncharacterized protein n=1 Tax=Tanacetum coccineum TaxID=301880 RepID=A0ABQ5HAE0_9ASTR